MIDFRDAVCKLRLEFDLEAVTLSALVKPVRLAALLATALLYLMQAQTSRAEALLKLTEVGDAHDSTTVELRGMQAGVFNPLNWEANQLHWVRDSRSPLLRPREGAWRNIYAPSAVETADGWRMFYGAWDGVPTGNDRIYSTTTRDFVSFGPRETVIEHGGFEHVCNVNALATLGGGFEMVCTVYPDSLGLNKPAFFRSPDGQSWNGSAAPYTARPEDIVRLAGYDKYNGADINGMNVLLREGPDLRLYFGSFKDFGKTFRASRRDGETTFSLDGIALKEGLMVNDVKKFRTGAGDWYLMGLHRNRDELRFALSRDGLQFSPSQTLFESAGDEEKHIVALGWVVQGDQESAGRKVLGVLYGAGRVPSLDRNRIFARWLQKRAVLTSVDGEQTTGNKALGPDRQLLPLAEGEKTGRLDLFAEDGKTLLGAAEGVTVRKGKAYRVEVGPDKIQ